MIRDFEQMYWAMTRYAQATVSGDGVLLWKAGEQAGIYAIAEVIEPAQHLTEELDIGYWFERNQNQDDYANRWRIETLSRHVKDGMILSRIYSFY